MEKQTIDETVAKLLKEKKIKDEEGNELKVRYFMRMGTDNYKDIRLAIVKQGKYDEVWARQNEGYYVKLNWKVIEDGKEKIKETKRT